MTMRDDFAVLILTHGRAGKISTIRALRRFNYTGKIYLVIDDEDKQGDVYRAQYENVLTFSKAEVAEAMDEGGNFGERRSAVFARNKSWDLAREVGLKYFMQMDDDYRGFWSRTNSDGEYGSYRTDLDAALSAMIDYFETIPALSIAMAQGGDYIGGADAAFPLRKAMNTFLCDVDRQFSFVGLMNDDVSTFTSLSRRGELFLTIPNLHLVQPQTQTTAGGMTEVYREQGTYVKSFYAVMFTPSAVRISEIGTAEKRIHHAINWNRCAAQIIREQYRKAA
jgi:hypothetical protein